MNENIIELLGLENISDGDLNSEFKTVIPLLVEEIFASGKKATVNIVIEFEKVKDTATMVSTRFKISHKLPPREKSGIAYLVGDKQLRTEFPSQQSNAIPLFDPKTGEILKNKEAVQ